MRFKQTTWVGLPVFLAIGLAGVGSVAVALAADSARPQRRVHESLGYATPDEVYFGALSATTRAAA
jgi:hypothetical protein